MVATLATDILIVGAGLAGSVLGYQLRQKDHDVLVAELRDAHGKDKLCAGLFKGDALSQLEELYGADVAKSLEPYDIDTWTWYMLDAELPFLCRATRCLLLETTCIWWAMPQGS